MRARVHRFALVSDHLIEFNQLATQNTHDVRDASDMFNRVMTKDNIAVAAVLQSVATGNMLFVSNVHIHWDPEFSDVKLVQTYMLTEQISKLLGPRQLPVIVCGDFNSLPDSGVYKFLSEGRIAGNHADFETRAYGSVIRDGLHHRFRLHSAYPPSDVLPFTNYTADFVGVIDYIWYTEDRLAVTGILRGLSKDALCPYRGCPNKYFASDHIPLLVAFKLKTSAGTDGEGR